MVGMSTFYCKIGLGLASGNSRFMAFKLTIFSTFAALTLVKKTAFYT